MIRLIVIAAVIACAMLPSPVRSQTMTSDTAVERGYLAGRNAARPTYNPGATLLGAASGFAGAIAVPALLFGKTNKGFFLGASIVSGAVFISARQWGGSVSLEDERKMQGESLAFREGFRKGFADEVRDKRKPKARHSALVAAMPALLLVLAVAHMAHD